MIQARVALICVAVLSVNLSAVWADVRLPAIFSDHMVLQRARPIPVWGWAEAGESVMVELGGQSVATTADDHGKWQVHLQALAAGGPHTLTVSAANTIEVTDVFVGEVWVCSGQSNMEWPLTRSEGGKAAIAEANVPTVRLFKVPKRVAKSPQEDCQADWKICTPESVAGFSAVAYYFGKKLTEELDVPVGLIGVYWGGSQAEAWTTRESLAGDDDLEPILKRFDSFQPDEKNQAAVLYHGMLAPLIPYAMRGAIWYQGEANVGRAQQYAKLFPTMIAEWRRLWREGDFPFYFVQLAPYRYGGGKDPRACAELWEAQLNTLRTVSNTGMVVTNDIGNVGDIHPRNKKDVGERLARWALARTYGRPGVVYSGPLYESMEILGDRVRIQFRHAEGGLATSDEKPPSHFTIAGADQEFVPAHVEIDGSALIVSSPEVPFPVAVRFAWRDNAQPNLINKAGLPASAFRTDHFKMVTDGQR